MTISTRFYFCFPFRNSASFCCDIICSSLREDLLQICLWFASINHQQLIQYCPVLLLHTVCWNLVPSTCHFRWHNTVYFNFKGRFPGEPRSASSPSILFSTCLERETLRTGMWANAQHDGRCAEYRWRPLFNTAKFGWLPLPQCHAVMLPRRETRW